MRPSSQQQLGFFILYSVDYRTAGLYSCTVDVTIRTQSRHISFLLSSIYYPTLSFPSLLPLSPLSSLPCSSSFLFRCGRGHTRTHHRLPTTLCQEHRKLMYDVSSYGCAFIPTRQHQGTPFKINFAFRKIYFAFRKIYFAFVF